jgi:hypothetical protein
MKAYGDSSATPLTIATVSAEAITQATFRFTTTSTTSRGTTGTVGVYGGTASLNFQGTQATSGAVYKLTLESSSN